MSFYKHGRWQLGNFLINLHQKGYFTLMMAIYTISPVPINILLLLLFITLI
jgi:hypothetical protein